MMELAYQNRLFGERVGVVFGAFAPLHQGHLDLIMRAKKENDGGCIVIVCGYDGDKGEPLMPLNKRYRYVREMFADDDLVAVYAISDSELGLPPYPNGWGGWLEEFERIYYMAVTANERRWYVGEPDYANHLGKLGETVVLVERADNPISATMIRRDPMKHWDKIALPFRRIYSKNILIIGTASEGKTILTADVGKYFGAPYGHEVARDYMRDLSVYDWEFDSVDFMSFLTNQYNHNRALINSPQNRGVVIADSDAMTTRMYAELYAREAKCKLTASEFEAIAAMADEYERRSRWDRIYLLSPGRRYIDDHQRYMAHSGIAERNELYDVLCRNLKRAGKWNEVHVLDSGYYENFRKIVNDIKEMLGYE